MTKTTISLADQAEEMVVDDLDDKGAWTGSLSESSVGGNHEWNEHYKK